MLHLRGGSALSPFRLERLLAAARARVPAVAAVHAETVYFADTEQRLGDQERVVLAQLLNEESSLPLLQGELLLVVPRLGTQSPWSSKATDIIRNCGLNTVRRVERGTAYCFAGAAGKLPDRHRPQLAALIHDRMTETVLAGMDDAGALRRCNRPTAI
jgi:phosphoribosylformylglycinamidine synthase